MFFLKKNRFQSQLFSEHDFYCRFIKDMTDCEKEIIIESPYITSSRMGFFYPIFTKLLERKMKIHIITRDPIDHDEYSRDQATNEILKCNETGINIIMLKGNHHRKLAIIDRKILWEGSLNILSFNRSQEIMRRIESEESANQMFKFLKLERFI